MGFGQPCSVLLGRRRIHGWPALIRIPGLLLLLWRCLLQGRSLAVVGLQGRPLLAILGAPSLGKRRPPLLAVVHINTQPLTHCNTKPYTGRHKKLAELSTAADKERLRSVLRKGTSNEASNTEAAVLEVLLHRRRRRRDLSWGGLLGSGCRLGEEALQKINLKRPNLRQKDCKSST